MGIKFSCPACGRPLNVKSELAGKRGRCPKCQAKIDIPSEGATPDQPTSPATESPAAELGPAVAPAKTPGPSAAATPAESSAGAPMASTSGEGGVATADEPTRTFIAADPIAEAPALQWYAMPPGAANQYGPATGEEFRVWMQEGRIPADALVWRQDWPDWKRAGSVFPQLATLAPPTPPATAVGAPVPAAPVVAAVAPTTPGVAPLTQPGATPTPAAQAPIAQLGLTLPGAAPGMLPTAQPAAPAVDGFPPMPTEPATSRSTAGRGRAYRPRSNTGPIIAIVVLLLAMIPLTYFVWKVVSEQIVSPPASSATSAADQPKTGDAEAGDSSGDASEAGDDGPASSNQSEE